MKRIASAWFPNWPLTAWRKRRPRLTVTDAPSADAFGLVDTVKGGRRLIAVDEVAAAAGLRPGQRGADAVALVPELRTADHDPAADAELLMQLAHACERFSPSVAVDAPDGLLLDMSGGAHLWGGEAGLIRSLTAALQRWGAPVRLGLADTTGAAWAAARFGDAEATIPPDGQVEALARLPVEALRLAPETAASLRRLGLKTIGQVSDLPRAQLARRFGPDLLLRLDQALGRLDEVLVFRRPPTPWTERRALVEPISLLDDLVRVTGDLADALCERLTAAGQGGRRWEAVFHRVDGGVLPVSIGTALPNRMPHRLVKLFAPKLETVDPGFGIELVTLRADRVEPLVDRQADLAAPSDPADGLAALTDQLANRLGPDRVWRAAPRQSHLPERAVRRHAPTASSGGGWDPQRPRPVRLLTPPEPVEVIAPVPDDPPVAFTWRGRRRRIRRAEGPERIAEEWWRRIDRAPDPSRIRDYYSLEDTDGERFWLFRDGLYDAEHPPRWFVHGLFG